MFDYFKALDGLTDEEREIHRTVRAFVDAVRHPARPGLVGRRHAAARADHGDGRARHPRPDDARRLRRQRDLEHGLRPDLLRARARRLGRALDGQRAGQPRHVPDLRLRLRGAEAALPARARLRQDRRLLRADGVRRRQRPGRDAHARAPRRRRLGAQRLQDVDHEQPAGRRRRGLGQGRRRRRAGLPRRGRHDGLQRSGHAQQGEPAREHHRRARARGRARAGLRALPGQGRPQVPAGLPHAGALRHRLGRARLARDVPRARRSTTRRRARRSGARSPRASSCSTS